MLSCKGISKKYQEQVVIDDFTYEFGNAGFYLLFGESGSGKTTLLNILSGLLPFNNGNIMMDGIEFTDIVDKKLIAKKSDYITQDTFFVDFLNVFDNLRMITEDEENIKEMLEKFGLLSKSEQYPSTLSGGERQRLAIIRSLIGKKEILFLDEPTASLDVDNKLMIFEILSKIKEDVLIICSSHDQEAKQFADEIIEFEKNYRKCVDIDITEKGKIKKKKKESVVVKKEEGTDKSKKPISFFLKKWFKSKHRNRKSSVLFCIFLTISMCICSLADTPQNKMDSNTEYVYKVNMCMLQTYGKNEEEYERLRKTKGIEEVVIDYGLSVPIGTKNADGLEQVSPTYEGNVPVLPYSKAAFKLADKIKYGTYYTAKNQIILSSEMAEHLMGDSPEKLIGQTLMKEFYGIGEVEFEIVGIFDYFNDFEKMYLKAMGIHIFTGENYKKTDYENLWFINSEFTEQYADDASFYADGQRGYILFFDSYKDMKLYYNENYEKYQDKGDWLYIGLESGKLLGIFEMLCMVFLPLAFFVVFFTVLFYVNLIKTELVYNNKFISIFDYSGYQVNKVIRCFIFLSLKYQLKLCSVSMLSAFIITKVFNVINRKYMFVEFQLFTYNVPVLLAFIVFLILVSIIFTNAFFIRFKSLNWYENIIKQRDLI